MKNDIAICGMSGSGKSTNTKLIKKILNEYGYKINYVAFYKLPFNHFTSPHFIKVRRMRKKIDKQNNKESASKLAQEMRQTKNVKLNELTLLYFLAYIARILCFSIYELFDFKGHIKVYDRYFYDNIANCRLKSRKEQILARILLLIIPIPKMCFILTTKDSTIKTRRPWFDYNDYIVPIMNYYKELCTIIPTAILIDTSMDMRDVELKIKTHVIKSFRKLKVDY